MWFEKLTGFSEENPTQVRANIETKANKLISTINNAEFTFGKLEVSTLEALILEATYEATFYAALSNYDKTGNNNVFLTLVGGGVFGNKNQWIFDAIKKAIDKFSNTPLNIKIVSYGSSNLEVLKFIKMINIK